MAQREVVETVDGRYGPVQLVRLTGDDWNQHCHRCQTYLSEGDMAQDRGDHWHCKDCAR